MAGAAGENGGAVVNSMGKQSQTQAQIRREREIAAFLARHGWGDARREKLVDDASARRYFRLLRDGQSILLMDYPPDAVSIDPHGVSDRPERAASLAPVVMTTALFAGCGWRVPEIIAHDGATGLMLIEDFGDLTFTRALEIGEISTPALYVQAVDALIDLHRQPEHLWRRPELVTYGPENFRRQIASFTRDYLPLVITDDTKRQQAIAGLDALLASVLPLCWQAGEVVIHRDYHVDNLMLVDTDDGDVACGIIDFQDAAIAPRPYDLVSLLRDVRHDIGAGLETAMVDRYVAAFPDMDRSGFDMAYIACGMVRNFRILGRFGWLARETGKRRYLNFVPQAWDLILRGADVHLPALQDWVDLHIPPDARQIPHIPDHTPSLSGGGPE
ncbi:aminoglycoside phosphotransferase family protein [Thalassospira sp.]|uniref:aminoglycoside phosphotransferase family protein n=1 Tax=Thalassospira sp. TaxID=1912094 RepID=UPI00273581E4|nr:phosphotransferase [Thalassospira sp.]MDP2699046.1 phosphotransferase [Thalassospira sp.]